MLPPLDFWHAVDKAHVFQGVAADWRWLMGADYDAGRHFLYPVQSASARSYPCPRCRLPMRVTPYGQDTFIADHTDADAEETECPPLRDLTNADLKFLAVDWQRLMMAVSAACGLNCLTTSSSINWINPVAELVCGRERLPVYLIFTASLPHYTLVLQRSPTAQLQPAVLLMPTFDMNFRQLAQSHGHLCLALSDHVDLNSQGHFVVSKAAQDEVTDFRRRHTPPEATPEQLGNLAMAQRTLQSGLLVPAAALPEQMTPEERELANFLFAYKDQSKRKVYSFTEIGRHFQCSDETIRRRMEALLDQYPSLVNPLAAIRSRNRKGIHPDRVPVKLADADEPED